jgi:branched-chain amino acid transport system permease protein
LAQRRERVDRSIKVLTEDLYALTSVRNMLYVAGPRLLPCVLLLLLPLVMPNLYFQRVIIIAAIYALLALSWDFLATSTGLVSLGQSLFFGVGAYLAGFIDQTLGVPPVLAMPLSALVGGGICTFLLVPCLPLRGIYFSMTTLVYPLLMARLIEATGVLGGTVGLLGVSPLPGRWFEQYAILALLLVFMFSLRRLLTTDLGLVLRAIKDDDQAVKACAINVTAYKMVAVYIAASLGALAGAYFTHLYMFVGMSSFSLDLSILPMTCAVVGGMHTLAGPVLGALILIPLAESLRDLGTLRIVFYSLLLMGLILYKPEGIMSYLTRKYQQYERWTEI